MKPQFTLQTLLLSFVVVASALAAFEAWGLLVAAVIFAVAAYIRSHAAPGLAARNVFLTLFIICMALCCIGLVPVTQKVREAGRRESCVNHLGQIGMALQQYHEEHGHFPPAYVLGPDGKPWHSWRTLILPYLEQKPLYDKYRFDEPWNGPNNIKWTSLHVSVFECPSTTNASAAHTHYVAVVGSETMWPGDPTASLQARAGSPDETILLVEASQGIPWAEPRDLTYSELCDDIQTGARALIATRHEHSRNSYFVRYANGPVHHVGMADGGVHLLNANASWSTWRALLTRDGHDEREANWDLASPRPHWGHIGGLISLLLSTLLLIFRPVPRGDDPTKWCCPGEEEDNAEDEHEAA